MKKLIAIGVAVVLVITMFATATPVTGGPPDPSERAVYEANIADLDRPDPLDEGEVKVFADGSVEIKIKGAAQDKTYEVYFSGDALPPYWGVDWTSIGQFTTDAEGNCDFAGSISTGQYTAPVFAINRVGASLATQFASGFEIE